MEFVQRSDNLSARGEVAAQYSCLLFRHLQRVHDVSTSSIRGSHSRPYIIYDALTAVIGVS